MELHEKLRQYNRWRRGEEDWEPSERGPCPKELGELIDGAADRMEVLEREHAEFFEHWHEHRRALEAIVRVLGPAAPTCDGCAAEIAEALRIARKVGADSEALERPNVQVQRDSGSIIAGGSAGTQGSASCESRLLKGKKMGQLILHKDGAYNLYTTIADGPCYESALTLEQLEEVIRFELGEQGMRELPARLERAHKTGCSHRLGMTLAECIAANRAGENESELSFAEFVARYLTLTPNA